MSETTNYKLYITDDDQEKFLYWREKMNGPENSNMMKIDAALGALKSVSINATLLASKWDDRKQVLYVDGITPDTNGMIGVAHDATEAEMEEIKKAELYVYDQGDGTLTIAAFGDSPVCDIPVSIILLG